MEPINADDLEFDGIGSQPIHADELAFDVPSGGLGNGLKPAPVQRPKAKKPVKPAGPTLADMKKQAEGFTMTPPVRRGVPVIKKPAVIGTGDQLRAQAQAFEASPEQESVQIGMGDGGPEIVGVQRRAGESLDSFLKREAVFRAQQQASQQQDRAMRAGVRAENLAKAGEQEADPEKYLTAIAQGMGSSIRSTGVGLGLLAGKTGEEMEADPALANPMPRLNAQESQEWAVKRATGLGGALPMLAVGALPGGQAINALAGMAQMGGQTYEQARQAGQSHEEALASAVVGALPGMLQGFGIGSGKFFGNVAKGTVGSTVKGVGEQVGVGLTQKVLDNVNAKVASGYDPKRAVTDGLWEAVQDAAVVGGLAHGTGLLKGGLERSGIEASFGELADEHARQAGTELYAGIDPALVRDYLPRPETIRGMFKSIFGNKVAPPAEVSEKLDRSYKQMMEQVTAQRDAKILQVEQYPEFDRADPEHLKAVLDHPRLEGTWAHLLPVGAMRDPSILKYYERAYRVDDSGRTDLVVTDKETGQEVAKVDTAKANPFMEADMAIALDAKNKGRDTVYDPILKETYEALRKQKDADATLAIEQEAMKARKHVARWLDKQKWLVQQQARKEAGSGMATRLGDEPQGIVVHNISPRNLSKLLEAAGGDISKASQPMPSIGVIHPETNFDSFGGVTLIGTPGLVEDAVKSGTAYPTDFYTPTVSDALYKIETGGKVTPETAAMIVEEMKRQTVAYGEQRLADPDSVFGNAALMNSYAKAGGGFESMEAVRKGLMALKAGAQSKGDTPEFASTNEAQRAFNGARRELKISIDNLTNSHGYNGEQGTQFKAKLKDGTVIAQGTSPESVQQGASQWILKNGTGGEFVTITSDKAGFVAHGMINVHEPGAPWEALAEDGGGFEPNAHYLRYGDGSQLNKTIDQYLLTQLAKEELPSGQQLTNGIWKLVKDSLPEGADAMSLMEKVRDLGVQAADAFETFRNSPTIYMEAQPAREVKLDEYVAALVPHSPDEPMISKNDALELADEDSEGTPMIWDGEKFMAMPSIKPGYKDPLNKVADTLAQQGLKVYRYSSPEEKVAIQKALAQFKDLAVDPNSKYGALYSNPVFDPEAWRAAKQAWLPGQEPDPEVALLKGTEHQPGVSEPPVPPSEPPAGSPAQPDPRSPLYDQVVATKVLGKLQEGFQQALIDNKLTYDRTLPPHTNLILAMDSGELAPSDLGRVLEEHGLNFADFASQIDESAATAGRQLQIYSRMQGFWNDMIKNNPQMARAMMGDRKFFKQALKTVQATELGQSLWNRMFRDAQGLAVSHATTLFTNLWGTATGIPLSIVDGFITGMGMRAMDPARFHGQEDYSVYQHAHEALKDSIKPTVAIALNAGSKLGQMLKVTSGARASFTTEALTQLEKTYPDLSRKLQVGEVRPWNHPSNPVLIDLMRDSLAGISDPHERAQMTREYERISDRQKFNQAWRGKLMSKGEAGLGLILKPLTWQEGALRNPAFLGHLDAFLHNEGLDLRQLIRDKQLYKANYDTVNRAVKQAGDLTWGARPEANNQEVSEVERIMESGAKSIMEGINKWGPANLVAGELLPGALYNGLKFAYEWSPLGAISPSWRLLAAADPVTDKFRPERLTHTDVQRLSRAVLSTGMFAAALALRKSHGGPLWYQLDTGKRDKDGKPVYNNMARSIPQLGNFLFAADLTQRVREGRLDVKQAEKDFQEVLLSARRTGDQSSLSLLGHAAQMWSDGQDASVQENKLLRPFGQVAALPFRPFLNLRDLVAQVDSAQDVKLDMTDHPLLGPVMDTLPWLRRAPVPVADSTGVHLGEPMKEYQPPTEPAGQEKFGRSVGIPPYGPGLAMLTGIKGDPALGFATREFQRLGLSPTRWLPADPDPAINRAQYAAYAKKLAVLGPKIEASERYQAMTDAQKAAFWEAKLAGPDGLAAEAKEAGQQANEKEMNRRELLRSQPPLQRKATGLDKKVEGMKTKK